MARSSRAVRRELDEVEADLAELARGRRTEAHGRLLRRRAALERELRMAEEAEGRSDAVDKIADACARMDERLTARENERADAAWAKKDSAVLETEVERDPILPHYWCAYAYDSKGTPVKYKKGLTKAQAEEYARRWKS